MSWKTIFFTVLTVLLVIFTIQNHLLVNLRFLNWELKDVPLIFVLLSGLVFGFLLALMFQLPRIIKLRRELKKVLRELENTEKNAADKDEVVTSEGVSMGSDYEGGFFNEKQ